MGRSASSCRGRLQCPHPLGARVSAIRPDNGGIRFILPTGNRRDTGTAVAISPNRIVIVLLLAVVTASVLSGGTSGRTVRGPSALQIVVFQPGANGTDSFVASGTPLWTYGRAST